MEVDICIKDVTAELGIRIGFDVSSTGLNFPTITRMSYAFSS
jgi:hypothetical protein